MEYHSMLSLVITYIIVLSGVQSDSVLPDLSIYNPLATEGFTVQGEWKHYTTPHTNVVGSATDFVKNGGICKRVVAFSAQGVVLNYYRTNCDKLDPRLGLLEAFGALWYYKEVLARQESEDKYTILFKGQSKTCRKKTYTIKQGRVQDDGNIESSVGIQNDEYCKLLAYVTEPKMKFLSSQSTLESATQFSSWVHFNMWEPLGIVNSIYRLGRGKMFRFVVFTSYGRVIEKFKVSGGPLQGVVLEGQALYYGNVAMVKAQGTDLNTFTILYNPNTGVCVKRTITLSSSNKRTRTKPEHIQESNQECKDLINWKTADASVPESQLVDLRKKFAEGVIDVNPYENGLSLQGKEQIPTSNDINLNQDLGVAFFKYTSTDPLERVKQIIVTAKGVPLAGILLEKDSPTIVARRDHLYYDNDIMIKKGTEENSFIVITKLNEDSCSEKTYTLKSEGGKMVKEEKGEVNITKDNQECKDLIEENNLKSPEADGHMVETEESEIIKTIEVDVKSVDADSENKEL